MKFHQENPSVNYGLKIDSVQRAVRVCRLVVAHFHRSWKKKRDLKKEQQKLGLPDHKLIHKRKTKGGLTSLLKQAVKIKKRKPEVLARNLSVSEAVQREILGYLSLPESDVEVDPLNWWKMNAQSFPHLSMLACKYLCSPATSVPSERLFSGYGLIVTPQRNRLSAETVQNIFESQFIICLVFLNTFLNK
ncbi:UNVERIFIED_CONTAM: hypothetical protein FKN15_058420 [Acipenser sinensis]